MPNKELAKKAEGQLGEGEEGTSAEHQNQGGSAAPAHEVAPNTHVHGEAEGRRGREELVVRRMSEDEGTQSNASSGAKVFPEMEVVSGNRRAEEDCQGHPREEMEGNRTEENEENAEEASVTQQVLLDTQLEPQEPHEHADMDVVEGDVAAGISASEGDGSYGSGRVQSNLAHWLL